MSQNLYLQRKAQNKLNLKYFLSSNKSHLNNNNKSQKRATSQKKFLPSDILTQVPSSNLYLNNIYSNNNNLHQQAFTPINRRKKLYEDEFLIPKKLPKFKDKKTLVLDLDETLVHSSFFPFGKNDVVLHVSFDGVFYNIYVLIRPWVEQFIKEMGKIYEIIIFTASIEAYASPLLDILDKEKNIQYRLYRDHCNFVNGVFIKDLKRLNRNLKDVIILDNSPLAYAFDVDNGLPILSWFDNRDDKELVHIEPLLKFLAKVDDVRKYIKKFLRNNCINYEIANRIIKDYEEGLEHNKNKNEENIKEKNENKDKNNENEEEKGESKNNESNDNNKRSNNNNKGKNKKNNYNLGLLNNFIIKNDINKITNLINDDIKKNNINNLNNLENKINILKNQKKSIKLKLQNNNNNFVKSFELDKRNNLLSNKMMNKTKNSEKKDIFSFGIKKENTNNISLFNKKINPQLKLQGIKESNLENDIKINDNLLMPILFPQSSKASKTNNSQISQNNKKINTSKNIQKKTNNIFKKSSNNSIEPISLKKTLNSNMNSSTQYKYLNLLENFQEGTTKSASLKAINISKNNLKINNNNKFKMNNSSANNKKNKMNLKNRLRLSSKPFNNLNNQNMDINIYIDKNKMSDLYSHVLRSKSTGNFIKLKSAHPRTPKITNNIFQSNLKLINNEDDKITNFNK